MMSVPESRKKRGRVALISGSAEMYKKITVYCKTFLVIFSVYKDETIGFFFCYCR